MKLFLFVVSSSTSYRLHRLVAQHCVAQGHRVALVYDQPADALYEQLKQDALLWSAYLVTLDELVISDAVPQLRWLRMPHPVRARFFSWLTRTTNSIHRPILGARLAAAQALLTRLSPTAIVVAEDGISGPAALIAAARSLKLPVIDLPYGYGTQKDLDNSLDEKRVCGELLRPQGWLGWMLRTMAPVWIKKKRHAGVVMFPDAYIAAREALGMTLRNAWIVHGGYADQLLVESEQMMALYQSEGIPAHKLVLTGSPYCDVIAQALAEDRLAQAAFRQPWPIEPNTLRLLVSWPTSYHSCRAEHCEFPSYEVMTEAVLGWLHRLPGCSLTVSLHPAVPSELRVLLERMGLNISPDYVIELIPKHDVYISYFSSTQRWAIACGKPVVNYDAYGVGLSIYDAAPGFIGTRRFEEFKSALLRLIDIDNGFKKAAEAQIEVAEKWGRVDGGSTHRILDVLLKAK